MKSAPSEASSDLERAHALSRALARRAPEAPGTVASPGAEPPYARLASRRAASPPSRPKAPLPSLEVGARWSRIVEWAREATAARAAFAIDGKGLLVGASGVEDEEATRIGGRLGLAFDQSSQIDRVRSLVIDWAGENVTVIELRDRDDVAVLLGILTPRGPIEIPTIESAITAVLRPTDRSAASER